MVENYPEDNGLIEEISRSIDNNKETLGSILREFLNTKITPNQRLNTEIISETAAYLTCRIFNFFDISVSNIGRRNSIKDKIRDILTEDNENERTED